MQHKLIIHVVDGQDEAVILKRLSRALPVYRANYQDKGQRLTVRLENDIALVIYHSRKDLVIFTQEG